MIQISTFEKKISRGHFVLQNFMTFFFYLDLELKNNQGDASLPCMKGRCTMAHKSSRRLPYAFSIHSKNLILFWGNSFHCDLPDIKQITSMIDIFLLCFALILIFSDALGILFLRAAKVHVYSPLWPLQFQTHILLVFGQFYIEIRL